MISHKEFVVGYENGSLGCSVSAWLTLRLFFAGDIREKKVSVNLFLWSVSFLVLIITSVIGFLNFPVLWALLGTIAILVTYVLAFFYLAGELVLSAALANKEFYEFAEAKRVLWVYSDDENNLPKTPKALPLPRARRPRRRF
jgi:hypothetical protein